MFFHVNVSVCRFDFYESTSSYFASQYSIAKDTYVAIRIRTILFCIQNFVKSVFPRKPKIIEENVAENIGRFTHELIVIHVFP